MALMNGVLMDMRSVRIFKVVNIGTCSSKKMIDGSAPMENVIAAVAKSVVSMSLATQRIIARSTVKSVFFAGPFNRVISSTSIDSAAAIVFP